MTGNPTEWNIVVVGAWNRAILTPAWISTQLFRLSAETPIQVDIPMDQSGPIRVRHEGLTVTPARGQLVVTPVEASPSELKKAASIAALAMRELPRTPMRAAGINLRYRFGTAPQEMLDLLRSEADARLADEGFSTRGRCLQRSLEWNDGRLNVDITVDENSSATLLMNFHCQSDKSDELCAWAGRTDEMVTTSHLILKKVIQVETQGAGQ